MSRSHTFNKETQHKYVKQSRTRRTGFKKYREYFLILCEGTKTEPNYFESFKKHLPRDTVDIEIEGLGQNTLSIM